MNKIFLIINIATIAASALVNPAVLAANEKTETVGDICGAKSARRNDSQLDQLCRGAYSNGEAWVAGDNNARVWAPVAVVCAYSCISGIRHSVCSGGSGSAQSNQVVRDFQGELKTIGGGGDGSGSTSTSGSGGGNCGLAETAGNRAYRANQAADDAYEAAKENGRNARLLRSSRPGITVGNGVDADSSASTDGGIPGICHQAKRTGAVQGSHYFLSGIWEVS